MFIMRNKNVRKRIIILTFMMALCLPLFFASTFAKTLSDNCVALGVSCDDSNICGSPAPTFALMTDFMTEMLMAIKTVGTRDPYI
ncbi:hypothetical protein KKH82_01935 [Patescibacteria group bacterium]|nr:hypothetical protein [Patescibacteria group bacterium]